VQFLHRLCADRLPRCHPRIDAACVLGRHSKRHLTLLHIDPAIRGYTEPTFARMQSTTVCVSPLMSAVWVRAPALA